VSNLEVLEKDLDQPELLQDEHEGSVPFYNDREELEAKEGKRLLG